MLANDQEISMPEHFFKRKDKRSPNYFVRLIAPKALRPYLDKKDWEYRASTGTSIPYQAKLIGTQMIVRKQKEWDDLLKSIQRNTSGPVPTSLTQSLIQQIAGARLNSWIYTDDDERIDSGGIKKKELSKIKKFTQQSIAAMESILAQGKASNKWPDVVTELLEWCETLDYSIDLNDPLFMDLVRAYAHAERKAQNFIKKRNAGKVPPVENIRVKIGTNLSVMSAAYLEHKSASVKSKTLSKYLSIWKRFVQFKKDIFLNDITSGDIYDFLHHRLHAGNDSWSQSYANGPAKRVLKEIFALARTLGHMTQPNPILNLESTPQISKKEEQLRKKPRHPFTSIQMNTLFASEWYDPTSRRWRGKLRTDLAVRYWAPLIAMLHSSRVREYMQLTTDDVVLNDGLPCFDFKIELQDDLNENPGLIKECDFPLISIS